MPEFNDYVVKDIGLADWGRKEISLAETEMPGLMATREEYGATQPLRGARIAGSLHMTIQTAVLIETLQALGADVRWASCNIYSTQDHAAAAIAAAGTPVFAYKGESLEDYWDYCHRIFEWSDGGTANMILDDGGDATLLLHLGIQAADNPSVIAHPTNEEEEVLFAAIKKRNAEKPGWYAEVAKHIKGVTEETTTGVHRLYQMAKEGRLLFPDITVYEHIELGAARARTDGLSFAERVEWIHELFPILLERREQKAGTMSGGQQQMLAIARGLMANPRCLMLDEPSLGLAPILVDLLEDTIRSLNESGMTVLLVEQRVDLALRLARRGYVLETGKVVLEDSAASLLSDPRVKTAYLGI